MIGRLNHVAIAVRDVAKAADEVRQKIIDGWSPFTGEIKDSTGKVRIEAGKTMTDLELYYWDWSIEGVSGLAA